MPTGGLLKQEYLNDKEPTDWSDKGFKILCKLDFKYNDATGILGFNYDAILAKPDTPGTLTQILNIDVYEDVEITIRLSRDKEWYWSSTLAAITTKKDNKTLYGQLLYENDHGVFEDSGPIKNCRAIRFVAAKNEKIAEKAHGFSMNIELVQPDGLMLPITLDPDIKNPPPGGTFLNPVGGSPFLSAL